VSTSACDPLGVAHGEQLRDGPARVVADDHGALESEVVEQLGDQVGDRRRSQIGARPHRDAVAAERQVRRDHSRPPDQGGRDLPPEGAVEQQAVQQDDRVPCPRSW
jgi:hypothetical protein